MRDEEQIHSGFVRRRRYLIVLSLALAAAHYIGLTFDRIDVLGNSAEVTHPEHVIIVGYIAWIFALWNYAQWFNDYDAWSKTKNAQKILMYERLRAKIFPNLVRIPDAIRRTLNDDARRNEFGPDFTVFTESAGILHPADKLLPTHIRVNAVPQVARTAFDIQRGNATQFDMLIPEQIAYQCFVSSLLSVLFTRRYFFEYFSPFLIGLFPIVSMLIGKP